HVDEVQRARLLEGGVDLFERFDGTGDFTAALCKRLGATDVDDAWDLLFEARPRELGAFQDAITAYGSAVRLGTPAHRIERQGDYIRAQVMAASARAAFERTGGPVVLVCGAAHLLGIDHHIAAETPMPSEPPVPGDAHRGIHLVPYDFTR